MIIKNLTSNAVPISNLVQISPSILDVNDGLLLPNQQIDLSLSGDPISVLSKNQSLIDAVNANQVVFVVSGYQYTSDESKSIIQAGEYAFQQTFDPTAHSTFTGALYSFDKSDIYVDGNYTGVEVGTLSNPFKTVKAAYDSFVAAGVPGITQIGIKNDCTNGWDAGGRINLVKGYGAVFYLHPSAVCGYSSWDASNDYGFYLNDATSTDKFAFVGGGKIQYCYYGIRLKSGGRFEIDEGLTIEKCGWDGLGWNLITNMVAGSYTYTNYVINNTTASDVTLFDGSIIPANGNLDLLTVDSNLSYWDTDDNLFNGLNSGSLTFAANQIDPFIAGGGLIAYDAPRLFCMEFFKLSIHHNVGGAARIQNVRSLNCTKFTVRNCFRGFRPQDCGVNGDGIIYDALLTQNLESGIYLSASNYESGTGCENFLINNYVSTFNANNGSLVIGGNNNTIGVGANIGNWNGGIYGWYVNEFTTRTQSLKDNNRVRWNALGRIGDAQAGLQIHYNPDTVRTNTKYIAKLMGADIQNTGLGANTLRTGLRLSNSTPNGTFNRKQNLIIVDNNTFNDQDIHIDESNCDGDVTMLVKEGNEYLNAYNTDILYMTNGKHYEFPYSNHYTNLNSLDVRLTQDKGSIEIRETATTDVLQSFKINTIMAEGFGTTIRIHEKGSKKIFFDYIPVNQTTITNVDTGVTTAVNGVLNTAVTELSNLFINNIDFSQGGGGGGVQSLNLVGNNLTITDTQGGTFTEDLTTLDVSTDAQVSTGAVSGGNIILTLTDGDTVTINASTLINGFGFLDNSYNVDGWVIKVDGNGRVAGTNMSQVLGQNDVDNQPYLLGKQIKANEEYLFIPPSPFEETNSAARPFVIGVFATGNGNYGTGVVTDNSLWEFKLLFANQNGIAKIVGTGNTTSFSTSFGVDLVSDYNFDKDNPPTFSLAFDTTLNKFIVYNVTNDYEKICETVATYSATDYNIELGTYRNFRFLTGSIREFDWEIVNEFTAQESVYIDGMKISNALKLNRTLEQGERLNLGFLANKLYYFGTDFTENPGSPYSLPFGVAFNGDLMVLNTLERYTNLKGWTINTSNTKYSGASNSINFAPNTNSDIYISNSYEGKVEIFDATTDEVMFTREVDSTGAIPFYLLGDGTANTVYNYATLPDHTFQLISSVTLSTELWNITNESTTQGAVSVDGLKSSNVMTTRKELFPNQKMYFKGFGGNKPNWWGFGFVTQDPALGNPISTSIWNNYVRWDNAEAIDQGFSFNWTLNTSNPLYNSGSTRWESPNPNNPTNFYWFYKSNNILELWCTDQVPEALVATCDTTQSGQGISFSIGLQSPYPAIPINDLNTLPVTDLNATDPTKLPSISDQSLSIRQNRDLNYQIVADASSSFISSYAFTNLPSGVTGDTTTGLITGQNPAQGTYAITVEAFNRYGSDTCVFTLNSLSFSQPSTNWNSAVQIDTGSQTQRFRKTVSTQANNPIMRNTNGDGKAFTVAISLQQINEDSFDQGVALSVSQGAANNQDKFRMFVYNNGQLQWLYGSTVNGLALNFPSAYDSDPFAFVVSFDGGTTGGNAADKALYLSRFNAYAVNLRTQTVSVLSPSLETIWGVGFTGNFDGGKFCIGSSYDVANADVLTAKYINCAITQRVVPTSDILDFVTNPNKYYSDNSLTDPLENIQWSFGDNISDTQTEIVNEVDVNNSVQKLTKVGMNANNDKIMNIDNLT